MLPLPSRADIVRTMPGYNAQDLFSSGESWEDWEELDGEADEPDPDLDPQPPDLEAA